MAIENLQKSEGITSHKSDLLNSHVSVLSTCPGGLPCGALNLWGILKTKTDNEMTPFKW